MTFKYSVIFFILFFLNYTVNYSDVIISDSAFAITSNTGTKITYGTANNANLLITDAVPVETTAENAIVISTNMALAGADYLMSSVDCTPPCSADNYSASRQTHFMIFVPHLDQHVTASSINIRTLLPSSSSSSSGDSVTYPDGSYLLTIFHAKSSRVASTNTNPIPITISGFDFTETSFLDFYNDGTNFNVPASQNSIVIDELESTFNYEKMDFNFPVSLISIYLVTRNGNTFYFGFKGLNYR